MAQPFPRWTNQIPIVAGAALPLVGLAVVFGVWYWFSPKFTDVGYQPEQPIPSAWLHAGDMGMDCRYCHNTVEGAAHGGPAHGNVHELPRGSRAGGEGSPRSARAGRRASRWVKVHMLPDYAYFDHSVHVAAGVGCVSCRPHRPDAGRLAARAALHGLVPGLPPQPGAEPSAAERSDEHGIRQR